MEARARTFTAWMRSTGITAAQVNEATGSFMGSHYLTDKQQPAVATADLFDKLRPLLPPVPAEIEALVRSRTVESENMKRRAVVSAHVSTSPGCNMRTGMLGGKKDDVGAVTAAYTDAAKAWQGWGTALKPAYEPIIMARKPLTSTVAANVLAHGTGAINVDGCRVGTESTRRVSNSGTNGDGWGMGTASHVNGSESGRWPANVLHDGSDEMTGLLGDAARFFYCAKASKADRDEGCDGLTTRKQDETRNEGDLGGDNPRNRGASERSNHHPTVKPTDLMRYLCRLVTPPGGTVLDPFMGSGSTGKAATLEGFSFVGCELQPEYMAIAEARILHAEGEVEPLLRVRS
jgi:site-specific DNA-methyltransferase (adenine-specific)